MSYDRIVAVFHFTRREECEQALARIRAVPGCIAANLEGAAPRPDEMADYVEWLGYRLPLNAATSVPWIP